MKETANCGCPWSTMGATLPITGCRFTLAPMTDDYVNIILNAVKNVNTSKIWSETDKTSTVYRGKRIHVVDAVKACFIKAYHPEIHMTSEMTFSKGCPGDSDADCFMSENDILLNEASISKKTFHVVSKISFYPLGTKEYMQGIIDIVNMAKEKGLYVNSAHYCTILQGDVHDIYNYFNDILAYADMHINHYVLQATVSVNSPTKE